MDKKIMRHACAVKLVHCAFITMFGMISHAFLLDVTEKVKVHGQRHSQNFFVITFVSKSIQNVLYYTV